MTNVLFQVNKSGLPKEPVKLNVSCDFSDVRKLKLITAREPFQSAKHKRGCERGSYIT